MKTDRCAVCGAAPGCVGVVSDEKDADRRELCVACLGTERVRAPDPDFGVGVPGLIAEECTALRDLLIAKNQAYGNSALDPVRVFSRASPEEQILVRIDDKISRLKRGSAAGEDVIQDLLGYLILLRIARRVSRGAL